MIINTIGIIAGRFTTYFKTRGRHEIVSFLHSVAGFMTMFLLAPDNQQILSRITNGDLSKEALYSFGGALFITALKTSSYMLTGNKALIRTGDKQ